MTTKNLPVCKAALPGQSLSTSRFASIKKQEESSKPKNPSTKFSKMFTGSGRYLRRTTSGFLSKRLRHLKYADSTMEMNAVIAALDGEISRLQQARNLLASSDNIQPEKLRSTRPSTKAPAPSGDRKPARKMSEAGRARIAAAQKKRWATQRAAGKDKSKTLKKAEQVPARKLVPRTTSSSAAKRASSRTAAKRNATQSKKTSQGGARATVKQARKPISNKKAAGKTTAAAETGKVAAVSQG